MVDRAVRWGVVVAVFVVFVVLKGKVGVPVATGLTVLLLLTLPAVLRRSASGRRGRD